MAVIKHNELVEELGAIVGDKYVSDNLAVLLTYTRDMSSFPATAAQGAVVRPGSVEEVVQIVRLANQTRTPLIPMGGKASVSGNPPGQPGRGIVVDMRRMDKILEIDKVHMAVTCQCGIVMGELAGKCHEQGYECHTAMQPHFIDTVGGHISGTPGAGFSKYSSSTGFIWHYLLGMKVVLPDATVIDTGTGEGTLSTYRGHTFARAMHGPDLTGLFQGDGGIFGIKVEATYRIFHFPKFKKAGARGFDTEDQAFAAYSALWEIDSNVYMQPYCSSLMLGPETPGVIPHGSKPLFVLVFANAGNTEEEVDFKMRTTEAILDKCSGAQKVEQGILEFAQGFIGPMQMEMGQMATLGQLPLFELILSRKDILEAYKFTRAFVFGGLRERGFDPAKLKIINGLLTAERGHGMTTIIPCYDANDKELATALHEMLEEWLEQCMRRGYMPEATAGHEANLKARQWTGEYYHFMRAMKKWLDPNNIMNPGVFFP